MASSPSGGYWVWRPILSVVNEGYGGSARRASYPITRAEICTKYSAQIDNGIAGMELRRAVTVAAVVHGGTPGATDRRAPCRG